MGDNYYIVGELDNSWEYVCYGKQRELYANRKELLASFLFIERCYELSYPIQFIKSGSLLEYRAMRHFKASVEDWTKYVTDLSNEYLGYAEEELKF